MGSQPPLDVGVAPEQTPAKPPPPPPGVLGPGLRPGPRLGPDGSPRCWSEATPRPRGLQALAAAFPLPF